MLGIAWIVLTGLVGLLLLAAACLDAVAPESRKRFIAGYGGAMACNVVLTWAAGFVPIW